MKRILLSVALALIPPGLLHAAAKPNILVIYTDDHGWADVGAQRVDQDIRTPHLDQLVRDGVLFTRGYVTAPQCAPSRAGLMTGRYQQRFGFEDNACGPLPRAELTIAERLKPAGYVSGFVGKSHLDIGGDKKKPKGLRVLRDHLPHTQGFDEYWRGELRQFFASHALDGTPFPDAPRLVVDNRFRVVVQTEAALSFLDRRAAKPEQPWFLYLAWFAPHVPLESPEPWFSKTPAKLPLERRQALAMIAAMDDGLGRIRAKLRAMGQTQNTLIFFISDNGAPLGKAWDGSLNKPLVGQKGMLSEGGIRVPFVAAWPGRIPAGQVYGHPVSSLDVAATAVAIAGNSPHARPGEPSKDLATGGKTALDGVDLMPFLTGQNKAAPHQTLYWRWGSQAAVLEMPYKLITLGDRERLLFDVTQPDGENRARNLLAKRPDVATRLGAKLKAWADTLQPPGLPARFDRHHEGLFAEHNIIADTGSSSSPSRNEPPGSVQGWLCRNGTLVHKGDALVIAPDVDAATKSRVFVTHSDLDISGPVTARLRVRAQQGGKSTFTWRTKQQPDFLAENTFAFDWPRSADWQQIEADLPVKGRLIHLRITPGKEAAGLEIECIELRGKDGKPQVWRFTATK
jgi:uncharacterized sulfatase